MRKLFKGGNYSRAETICGNTVYGNFTYITYTSNSFEFEVRGMNRNENCVNSWKHSWNHILSEFIFGGFSNLKPLCAVLAPLLQYCSQELVCLYTILYNTDFFKDQLTERILAFNNIVKFKFRAKNRGHSVASTVIFLRPTRPIWPTR